MNLLLQAQFIHYRENLGSMAKAKTEADGLAILGVFFTVISLFTCHKYNDLYSFNLFCALL